MEHTLWNLYKFATKFFNILIDLLWFILAIPEDGVGEESEDEDKVNPDERISIRASDKRLAPDNEYSDSEDEGDSRRDERNFKPKKKTKTNDDGSNSTNAGSEEKKDEKTVVTGSAGGATNAASGGTGGGATDSRVESWSFTKKILESQKC